MPKQEINFKNVVFQKEGQNMLTGIFSERDQLDLINKIEKIENFKGNLENSDLSFITKK